MRYEPFVSVIIPTHNRSRLLQRAIGSVLNQTYKNLEVLVVDDASTDDTKHIVAEITDERLVYLCHQVSRHASAARNTGLRAARSEYIAFLDDDDVWLPFKLERQMAVMQRCQRDVGLVYCWFDYYDGAERVGERHATLRGSIFDRVLEDQPIGNGSTWVVRSHVFDEVGAFDERLRRGVDGDFVRRACREYLVEVVPEVLVHVHVGHGHQRITSQGAAGLHAAIQGESVKLKKFPDLASTHPRQFANINSKIAYQHAQLGEWKHASRLYWTALKARPWAPKTYYRIGKGIVRAITHKVGL